MVSAFLNLLSLLLLCQKGRWGSKSILISQNFLSHQVSGQNLLCHWKSCLLNVISLNLLATFFNIHEFILYSTKHTINVLEQIYTGNYHGPPNRQGYFYQNMPMLTPTHLNLYVYVQVHVYVAEAGQAIFNSPQKTINTEKGKRRIRKVEKSPQKSEFGTS